MPILACPAVPADAALSRFVAICRPYLKANPALTFEPAPPKEDANCRLRDLIHLKVECPTPPQDAAIPHEWLEQVVRGLRKNTELAVQLCEEVDDLQRFHISPIKLDERPDIGDHERTYGLSGYVIWFASLFERLIAEDISRARREFLLWPTDDDSVFSRLRFWAAGNPKLATPHTFFRVLKELSVEAFWSADHQRDLLLALAARWHELPERSRRQLEERLLDGPARHKWEEDAVYERHKAWATLERLQWLADNKCSFSFDVEEIARRRRVVPEWKPQYAKGAVESQETRVGWGTMNTEHAALLREPIGSVLSKALELSGRTEGNTLEERRPFAGLCAEHPVRAYCAFIHAARQNSFPQWAWKTFLDSPGRKNDKPKFSAIIAERVCRFPDEALTELLYPSTRWLQKASKPLSKEYPSSFDKAASRLIDGVHREPSEYRYAAIGTSRGRDWVGEALNSPAGHITGAVLEDSRVEVVKSDVVHSEEWLCQLERLLALSSDARRHAIAIVSRSLDWFHRHFPDWTEQHLLSTGYAGEDQPSRLQPAF